MRWKKLILSNVLSLMVFYWANAQRVLSEARLEYTISVTDNGKEATTITSAFKNAVQVVWLRSNMCRTDFTSPQRNQSVIFNSTTGEATILREASEEKFMWLLDSLQWKKVNNRYAQSSFSATEETKEIAGYLCKKGVITLGDSTEITVFYTPQLLPLARGYDPMFEILPGFPVKYEWKTGNLLVHYTLSNIQNIPVGSTRFENPKEGYKIIKAPIKEPL